MIEDTDLETKMWWQKVVVGVVQAAYTDSGLDIILINYPIYQALKAGDTISIPKNLKVDRVLKVILLQC